MKTKISAVSFLHEKTSSGAGTWVGYATLSLALLLGLLLPPAARGAAFINFNTPGQLTNYFGVRSTVAGPANTAVWYEVPSGGLGNSGALDGVTGSGTDNTLTYLGESYSWPSTGVGVTLNASMVFKAKLSSATGTPPRGRARMTRSGQPLKGSSARASWRPAWRRSR